MADQLTVVILAGGRGTRLQSVVSDRPKPMADVGGRPFLEFVLDDLVSQDLPLRVIMSVGYKANVISNHFGTSYRGIPLQYCVEAHALGTGGAIKKCAADFHLDRPFVVKNGDTFTDGDIGLMWQMYQRHQPEILISSIHVRDADRFGALDLSPVVDEQNLFTVRRFAEKQSSGAATYINSGTYLMSKDIVGLHEDRFSLEVDVMSAAAERTGVLALLTGETFVDIGVPSDYANAANILKSRSDR